MQMDTSSSETVPLKSENNKKPPLPINSIRRVFGTTCFLISAILASVIPIVQLVIGGYFNGQCPLEPRIPIYLIVSGSFGLVLAALTISLAVTFKFIVKDPESITLATGCGVCLNVMFTVLISVFLFIWFILGCVWVFSAHKRVNIEVSSSPDYCNPTLYKATFALLVISIIWGFLQCCFSCFRQCCSPEE